MTRRRQTFQQKWIQGVRDSELRSTTKLVLFVLSTYMDNDGRECYPSIRLLSTNSGLSRTSLSHHLDVAQSAGWIYKIKRKSETSTWQNNEYLATIGGKASGPRGGQSDGPRGGQREVTGGGLPSGHYQGKHIRQPKAALRATKQSSMVSVIGDNRRSNVVHISEGDLL